MRRGSRPYGYSTAHGCAGARLCPAFSLPDLFSGGTLAGAAPTALGEASADA